MTGKSFCNNRMKYILVAMLCSLFLHGVPVFAVDLVEASADLSAWTVIGFCIPTKESAIVSESCATLGWNYLDTSSNSVLVEHLAGADILIAGLSLYENMMLEQDKTFSKFVENGGIILFINDHDLLSVSKRIDVWLSGSPFAVKQGAELPVIDLHEQFHFPSEWMTVASSTGVPVIIARALGNGFEVVSSIQPTKEGFLSSNYLDNLSSTLMGLRARTWFRTALAWSPVSAENGEIRYAIKNVADSDLDVVVRLTAGSENGTRLVKDEHITIRRGKQHVCILPYVAEPGENVISIEVESVTPAKRGRYTWIRYVNIEKKQEKLDSPSVKISTDNGWGIVVLSSFEKVDHNWVGPQTVTTDVQLDCARNERESFQVLVKSERPIEDVRLVFSNLVCEETGAILPKEGFTAYLVGEIYSPIEGDVYGWNVDPLVPYPEVHTFGVGQRAIWVDYHVSEYAEPGMYTGTFMLVDDRGDTKTGTVCVRVREAVIPKEFGLPVTINVRNYKIADAYFKTDVPMETMLENYRVLLEARISIMPFGRDDVLRPDILMPYVEFSRRRMKTGGYEYTFDFSKMEQVGEYLFENGVPLLYVGTIPGNTKPSPASEHPGFEEFFIQYIDSVYEFLTSKDWLDKAYFYLLDEPIGQEAQSMNLRMADILRKRAPGLKLLLVDPLDNPEQRTWADFVVTRGFQQAEIGGEKWWYVCGGPGRPYPNFHLNYTILEYRLISWLTWKYDRKGFLYWGVIANNGTFLDFEQQDGGLRLEKWPGVEFRGDGFLCYPGPNMQLYPSVRLKGLRDGNEDWEILNLLKKKYELVKHRLDYDTQHMIEDTLSISSLVPFAVPESYEVDGLPPFIVNRDPNVMIDIRTKALDFLDMLILMEMEAEGVNT